MCDIRTIGDLSHAIWPSVRNTSTRSRPTAPNGTCPCPCAGDTVLQDGHSEAQPDPPNGAARRVALVRAVRCSRETLRPTLALEVLQAFNVERPQATTTQIAGIAGISRAAARRILLTLRELGYVEEVTTHYWRLTPKVLRLGFAFFSSQSIWSVIADDVRALAQEVNEPCAVAVLDGTDILYVIRDSTRRIISTHVSPGERLPAYAASLGKVLLAALPESGA